MDIVSYKQDVWGREVLLGISWELLWVVLVLTFVLIAVHGIVLAVQAKQARPSTEGAKLVRHVFVDRMFHWVLAGSILVLIATGMLPVFGVLFAWLTPHWVAGLILSLAVLLHIVRSLFFKDLSLMRIQASDFAEPFDKDIKSGKYSFAQKGIHWAMTLLVLLVIATGLLMFSVMDSPWWARSNWMQESTLGWTFVFHGLSTLGLVGLISLHIYFSLRPEKRFYTRSMIKGWISEHEHQANHDSELWTPDKSARGE